jgi:hypothetical protein
LGIILPFRNKNNKVYLLGFCLDKHLTLNNT